jgi:charged multivesicular body protein 2B
MQEFGKASTHMEMSEEMMSDALDDILNESGDEEEGDSIVQQVLDEIGIDISSKVLSYSTMYYVYYSYLDY